MTYLEATIIASDEAETEWSDMEAETQVIYALVREAIENAGYKLRGIGIELIETVGGSTITCKVEL